jgi:hypothetical protein
MNWRILVVSVACGLSVLLIVFGQIFLHWNGSCGSAEPCLSANFSAAPCDAAGCKSDECVTITAPFYSRAEKLTCTPVMNDTARFTQVIGFCFTPVFFFVVVIRWLVEKGRGYHRPD